MRDRRGQLLLTFGMTAFLTALIGGATLLSMIAAREPTAGATDRLDNNTATAEDIDKLQKSQSDMYEMGNIATAGGSIIGGSGPLPGFGATGAMGTLAADLGLYVGKMKFDDYISKLAMEEPWTKRYAGTWKTTWGTAFIAVTPDANNPNEKPAKAQGRYSYSIGTVTAKGTLDGEITGGVFEGRWTENAPTKPRRKYAAGWTTLKFNQEGTHFDGTWELTDGSAAVKSGKWTGDR